MMSEEVFLLVVYTFSAKVVDRGLTRGRMCSRRKWSFDYGLVIFTCGVYMSDRMRVGRVNERIIDEGLVQCGVYDGGAGTRGPYSSLQVGWRTPARPFNILTHPCIVEGLLDPWYV